MRANEHSSDHLSTRTAAAAAVPESESCSARAAVRSKAAEEASSGSFWKSCTAKMRKMLLLLNHDAPPWPPSLQAPLPSQQQPAN